MSGILFRSLWEVFAKHNHHYVLQKLRSHHVDRHWQVLLDELGDELEKGRMAGPYEAPPSWGCTAVSIGGMPLQTIPDAEPVAAFCFSVVQSDKVRRCEDFRRSGLNSTVEVHDAPHRDDIPVFVELIRAFSALGLHPRTWAQDLAGAYRQLGVRDPSQAYCVLMLPQGPLILRHNALSFGAVASVWGFNRTGDGLCFVARRLLWSVVGHFVDDFIGVGAAQHVDTEFSCFSQLFAVLGLRMKVAKALPPRKRQKLLGVVVDIGNEDVQLCPHSNRCEKLSKELQMVLTADCLSDIQAQRIAGKMQFLNGTLFGQLGKSALHPIYSRAHHIGNESAGTQLC